MMFQSSCPWVEKEIVWGSYMIFPQGFLPFIILVYIDNSCAYFFGKNPVAGSI